VEWLICLIATCVISLLTAGGILIMFDRGKFAWAAAAICLLYFAAPSAGKDLFFTDVDLQLKAKAGEKLVLVASYEDPSALVEVYQDRNGIKSLVTNRRRQESSDENRLVRSQRIEGYIPLLLHPNPKSFVSIGLGTGATVAAVTGFGLEHVTLVELSSSIVKAARNHFTAINNNLFSSSEIIINGGRHFLKRSKQRFDIIFSDVVHPHGAGAGTRKADTVGKSFAHTFG